MTTTVDAGAATARTSLADYLSSVLRRLPPLPPLDLDLTQAYGHVLAQDVPAPHQAPSFDYAAIDGYAVSADDLLGVARMTRLSVIGDLTAASWRPVRLTPGTCFSVAAGAPLPGGADTVVPADWTDQGDGGGGDPPAAEAGSRRAPRRR